MDDDELDHEEREEGGGVIPEGENRSVTVSIGVRQLQTIVLEAITCRFLLIRGFR